MVPFYSIEGLDIKKVNWCGIDLDIEQIVQKYHTQRKCRNGLMVFSDDTTCVRDVYRRLRKRSNWTRGDLYIKAYTAKHGLFELTLKDTHLKDLTPGLIWFSHEGISSYYILKKPTK